MLLYYRHLTNFYYFGCANLSKLMFLKVKNIFSQTLFCWFLMLAGAHFSAQAQVKFIPNKGQWQEPFLYKSNLPNGSAFITPGKIWYSFLDGDRLKELHHHADAGKKQTINGHALSLEWIAANPKPEIVAQQVMPTSYNYFLTNNQQHWHTNIKAYKRLLYKNLYKNIDMDIEGLDNALKYTYFVQKGGNPENIQLKISGAKKLFIKKGNLHLQTSINSILEEAPIAFQLINNEQVNVPCHFRLKGNILSFSLPQGYNKNYELVIDPTVIFATYSGSYADNFGFTATYDTLGNAYGGGTAYEPDFPVTAGAFQSTFAGGAAVNLSIGDVERDCSILKFSADGTELLWATYLGGSHNEQPHSMIVNSKNELLIFGTTYSKDFPVTQNAYDTSHNGKADIFIVRFSEDGTQLLASTFVGGTEDDGLNGLIPTGTKNKSPLGYNYGDQFRSEIICDADDNIYVGSATFSKDFPVSINAAQKDTGGKEDGCIFKMNSNLTFLLWASYIGGKEHDAVYSLQLDSQNNVYACGGTNSPYFFKDTITYRDAYAGFVDGFICVLNNDGKHFINSTYIGTSDYDQTYFIQLDPNQDVYVYGQTAGKFIVKNAAYSNPKSGQFITKLNNGLDSILVSSVFGSGRVQPDISPTAFLVDNCGKIYVSGWGGGTNNAAAGGHGGSTRFMPITPDAFQKTTDSSDFYLAVFAANMDTILYGSYFGGPISDEHVDGGTSRFDKKGVIYQSVCAGCSRSGGHFSDFPVTPDAYSKINNNSCNNLVFKVSLETPDIIVDFDSAKPACVPYTVQFRNKSIRARTYSWDFGDGKTSTEYSPQHTFDSAGTYTVRLIGTNFYSCSVHDTVYKKITVIENSDADFTVTPNLCTGQVTYEVKGFGKDFRWDFGDNTFGQGRKVTHTYNLPAKYNVKLFSDSATLCGSTSVKAVSINFPISIFRETYDTCRPVVLFTNYSVNAKKYLWLFSDGTTDTAKNLVHNFKTGGIYEAVLVAYDSTGCTDTSGVFVNVASEPFASFTVHPAPCQHKISFKNTSQQAKNYVWDFGDGKTSTAKDVTHEYKAPGTYTVKLTINADTNCTRIFTQTVKITFPTAGFTYNFEACKPIVKFSNKSIFSHKYIWSFGDGETDTSRNPSHFYKAAGIYLVKLLATDSAGCTDSAFVTLQVADAAAAAFTFTTDTCNGLVYFTNQSKMANTYLWIFGDGTTDTAKNPVHNYPRKNVEYITTLVINAPDGCIDSFTQVIVPMQPPKAYFSYLIDSCSSVIAFTNTAYRAQTFLWEFGDGEQSTEANPSHLYKNKGHYTVRLIVNANTACADTNDVRLYMPRNELSKPEIYNVITPNGDNDNEVFHIENLSQCHYYELEIYNRWGQIIYINKGTKMYWDGTTMKGKPVADGTYFYIFRDPIFGQQKGTITVIR